MSLKSRTRYHFRSLLRAWYTWRLPKIIDRPVTRLAVVVLTLIVSGAYITKTNELATSGYHINDLEKKLVSLQSDTEKLQVDIASLQSMPNINRRLEGLKMVAPSAVTYVKSGGGPVAKR